MDAQHSRDYGCQKHLQGHGHPADEQTHCNTTCYRASVKVPDHRLCEGISEPASECVGLAFSTANLLVQLVAQNCCIWQTISEPVTGHVWSFSRNTGVAEYLNVVTRKLLSFSELFRALGCLSESHQSSMANQLR